jgi:hypothetical protein
LTLTLNTSALNKSTLRRFGKVYYNTYPIVQFSVLTPFVRPLRLPNYLDSTRFRFCCRAYHLCKSFVSSFKELTIFVPCGNAGHTTFYNTVYKLWLGLSLLGKSCGFPKVSFYLERFVLKHATAHIPNVVAHLRKRFTEKV